MHHGVIRARLVGLGNAIPDDQPFGPGRDAERFAISDVPGQQHFCQRVLQRGLDHTLERARAKDRIVAFIGQPGFGTLVQFKRDFPGGQAF